MGLFGFGERKSTLGWKQLESVQELENLLAQRDGEARIFFKHSTRCAISAMALNGFESTWKGNPDPLYFIDLIRFREVSDALAIGTGVRHESPQVIVVRDGNILYQASHSSIDARKIEHILENA